MRASIVTTRVYRHVGIPASSLGRLRDYMNLQNSASLGPQWGHKVHRYKLHYPDGVVDRSTFDDVRSVIASKGDINRFEVYFESVQGRKMHLVATDPAIVSLTVDNGSHTDRTLNRIEELMGLGAPYQQRIFLTHGRSPLWREVQPFIEKDCNPSLPTIEMASRPHMGGTLIEKLEDLAADASYAVIVMTGDDLAGDEERARENVIHEIGYFQGRYGRHRVCLLHEEGVSIPTNLSGLGYCGFPKERVNAAFFELQAELQAAFPVL